MIIAIDTETGGTNPNTDALLSISACQFDDPKKQFTVFVAPDPELKIEPEAIAVNGYTPELWLQRGAVPLREALYRFKSWLPFSGNTPLAHNASFDKDFIEAAERQAKFKTYLQYRWHCSMSTFMFCDKVFNLKAPNFRLETLAQMSGHWAADFQRGAHQSADDVVACAVGYRWLMDQGNMLERRLQAALAENAMLLADVKELKKSLAKENAVEMKPNTTTAQMDLL